jgi:hypothetical protein
VALLTLAYSSLGKLDPEISARRAVQKIDASRAVQAYAFKLQRGWQYQVNFYLHREIAEWNPGIAGEAIVITPEKRLTELKGQAEIISTISDRSAQAEIVLVKPLGTVGASSAGQIPSSGKPR